MATVPAPQIHDDAFGEPPRLTIVRAGRRSRGIPVSIDRHLRRSDTRLARVLAVLSPHTGPAYTQSAAKRTLDLALAIPLALIAIPVILLLVAANKLVYPGHPALFRQDRVGAGGATRRVVKVRSLVPPRHGSTSPTATTFGRFIRRYYLDELPQIFQVIVGQLSIVGTRVLPREVYDGLAGEWLPERVAAWRAMYAMAPLGLTGVHQVFRGGAKHDVRRFHRDMFYARHASLGFDLYLLWRTLGSRDMDGYHPAVNKRTSGTLSVSVEHAS